MKLKSMKWKRVVSVALCLTLLIAGLPDFPITKQIQEQIGIQQQAKAYGLPSYVSHGTWHLYSSSNSVNQYYQNNGGSFWFRGDIIACYENQSGTKVSFKIYIEDSYYSNTNSSVLHIIKVSAYYMTGYYGDSGSWSYLARTDGGEWDNYGSFVANNTGGFARNPYFYINEQYSVKIGVGWLDTKKFDNTVTFNSNGGSACSSQSVSPGSYCSALPTPTKLGYHFDGWFSDSSFTTEFTSSTVVNSDMTVYAKWTASDWDLTFNKNGSDIDVSPAKKSVTFNTEYGTLPTPQRTGYTFTGWYTAPTGGTQVQTTDKMLTEGATIYAHWTPRNDTKWVARRWLQKVGAGDEENETNYTMTSTVNKQGTSDASISPDVDSIPGFTSPAKKTFVVKYDGTTVVDYYYKRNSYNVEYDANKGHGSITPNVVQYEDNFTASFGSEFSREHYLLESWNTDAEGNGTKLPLLVIEKLNTPANLLLYAQWTGIVYDVTLDQDGGSSDTDNFKFKYDWGPVVSDTDRTLLTSLEVPTKFGYSFDGYYYTNDSGDEIQVVNEFGEFTEDLTDKLIGEDTTVIAKWVPKKRTVTLKSDSPTFQGDTNVESTFNSKLPDVTIPQWDRTIKWNVADGTSIADTTKQRKFLGYWLGDTQYVDEDGHGIKKWDQDDYVELQAHWSDPTIALPDAERAGYTFSYWKGNTRANLTEGKTYKMLRNNETLIAVWEPNVYKVTINAGEGESEQQELSVTFGEPLSGIRVPVCERTINFNPDGGTGVNQLKNQKTFDGYWINGKQYVDGNGNGTRPYDVVGDAILEAHWSDSVATLPVSQKRGFDLVGWKTESGELVSGSYLVTKESQVLTAEWTPKRYIITLGGGDADGSASPVYGEPFDTSIPTKTQKAIFMSDGKKAAEVKYSLKFLGYWLGDTQYVDENGKGIRPWDCIEDCKLIAKWGTAVIEFPTDPKKKGYTFRGWKTGTKTDLHGSYTTSSDTGMEFIAQFTANVYDVTYNYSANGGTKSSKYSDKVAYGKEIDLTPEAEKEDWFFLGWNTDKNATQPLNEISMGSTDITLYALYTKRSVVEYWDGTEYKRVILDDDSDAKIFLAPDFTPDEALLAAGWVFKGWTKEPDKLDGKVYKPGDSISVSGNKTDIYAVYERKNTSTFHLPDGSNITRVNTVRITTKDLDNKMTAGSKTPSSRGISIPEGASVIGWVTSPDSFEKEYDFEEIYNSDTDLDFLLLLEWPITVVFKGTDLDDEEGSIRDNGKAKRPVSFTLELPEKEGYTFKGWDYNGIKYRVGDVISVDKSESISAIWEANKYTIEFDSNFASISDVPLTRIEAVYDQEVGLPKTNLRKEYSASLDYGYNSKKELESINATFLGWECNGKTIPDGGKVKNLISDNGASVKLNAQWKNDSITLPVLEREGYTFGGWTDGKEVYSGEVSLTKNLSLKAVWTAGTSKVSIDLDGGSSSDSDSDNKAGSSMAKLEFDVASGDEMPTLKSLPQRSYKVTLDYSSVRDNETISVAYKFMGIFTEKNGKGTKYYDENGKSAHVCDLKSGTKLYVHWESTSITLPKPNVDNCTILGWVEQGSDKLLAETYTPEKDVTLVLQKQALTYTIHYNLNGGKLLEEGKTEYSGGTNYTLPRAEKSGYVFNGWEMDDGRLIKSIDDSFAENLYLNAKFISISDGSEDKFPDEFGSGSIKIPDGTTRIKPGYFSGNKEITSVEVPGSVKSIEEGAFKDCTNLKSITLEEGLQRIGKEAFSGCTALESISIPSTVVEIGDRAFSGCTGLKSVDLKEGLVKIGTEAFAGCSSLESISIPSSTVEIGDGAFKDCTNLSSVTLKEGLRVIGAEAFKNCTSLTEIEIPESVESIGKDAFAGCTNLKSITIKNPECNIYLSSGTIPAGATIYGYKPSTAYDYSQLFNLEFVEIEKAIELVIKADKNDDEVVSKHYYTEGTKFPLEIKMPSRIDGESATLLGIYMDSQPALTTVGGGLSLKKLKKASSTEDGRIMVYDKNLHLVYNGEIPGSTVLYAVWDCKEINEGEPYRAESSTWVAGVQYQTNGESAVVTESADGLAKISIASSVVIGGKRLTVRTIKGGSFANKKELKEVNIPKSVTKIEANAFKGSKSLMLISIKGKTVLAKNALAGLSKKTTLKALKANRSYYKKQLKSIKAKITLK